MGSKIEVYNAVAGTDYPLDTPVESTINENMAFGDVLEPEVIAEKVKQPVEYVLKVLNEPMYISEDTVPYTAGKKE